MSDAAVSIAPSAPATSTPVATPEPGDGKSPSTVQEDGLLYTYAEEMKRPFAADYFDLTNIWDKEEGLTNELQTIEDYLKQKVTKKEIDNSTKAAKQYLKELEKKAGTNPYEEPSRRISKLLAYIDFRRVVDEP